MEKNSYSDEKASLFINYGIDIDHRKVFISPEDGNEEVILQKALRGIFLLYDISKNQPIKMYLSSLGGDVYDYIGLYDLIKMLSVPIYTIAYGKCLSSTVLLVLCASKGKRFSTKNCYFMVHDGYVDSFSGNYKDHLIFCDHWKEQDKLFFDILESNTSKPRSFWKTMCSRGDFYFDAKDAKKYGLIDHIVDDITQIE